MKICGDITNTVCPSPVIKLDTIRDKYGLKCELLAKCEFFNYGNCLESRLCNEFISELEKNGKIKSNSTIICGINVALLLALRLKGYKCVAVTNEFNVLNREIINLVKAVGVEIIENSCLEAAENHFPNAFVIDEIVVNDSILAILKEVIETCDFDIDLFVVGLQNKHFFNVVIEYVRQWVPYCKVVGFVTSDKEHCSDEQLIFVKSDEAVKMTKTLIAKEGLLCGVDSGAAVATAIKVAKELDEEQKCVVLLAEGIFHFMHNLAIDSYYFSEKIRKERTTDAWLWSTPVQNMASNMNRVTVTGDSKCSEVVRLMKKQLIKELAVLSNKDSSLLGIVTASDILDKITSGTADYGSPIELYSRNNYAAMNAEESVGKLMFLLERNPFVVVVDFVDTAQKRFIGLFTQIEALNFISYSTHSLK